MYMKAFYLKSQHGSVTIIAVSFVVFFSIILSGLMPMTINQLSLIPKNRDLIEAQYAAESGIKVALSQFNKSPNCVWGWLDTNQTFANDSTKKYKVSIVGPGTSTATPKALPEIGVYKITSIGKVGNSSKTVTANITISNTGSGKYSLYSQKNITMSGNILLHGNIGAAGTVTYSGNLNYGDNSSTIKQNQKENWWFSDFDTFTSEQKSDRPINLNVKIPADLKDQNYNNQTIIIDGDLTLAGNKSFSNASIFVTGNITYSGTLNFNNNCLIVSGKGMTLSGNNLGGAVYVSYGDITLSGIMNGGAIYAKGDITTSGNTTLTYSQTAVDGNGLNTAGNNPIVSGWNIK